MKFQGWRRKPVACCWGSARLFCNSPAAWLCDSCVLKLRVKTQVLKKLNVQSTVVVLLNQVCFLFSMTQKTSHPYRKCPDYVRGLLAWPRPWSTRVEYDILFDAVQGVSGAAVVCELCCCRTCSRIRVCPRNNFQCTHESYVV